MSLPPAVHGGGMSFGTDPHAARSHGPSRPCAESRSASALPNVTDIAAIARACEEAGADALSLINTMLSCASTSGAQALSLPTEPAASRPGGIPGGLRWSGRLRGVDIPILHGRRVQRRNVVRLLWPAATAVQSARPPKNPWACRNRGGLPALLESLGVTNSKNSRGAHEMRKRRHHRLPTSPERGRPWPSSTASARAALLKIGMESYYAPAPTSCGAEGPGHKTSSTSASTTSPNTVKKAWPSCGISARTSSTSTRRYEGHDGAALEGVTRPTAPAPADRVNPAHLHQRGADARRAADRRAPGRDVLHYAENAKMPASNGGSARLWKLA